MLTPATWAQLLPRNVEMMHSALYPHAASTMSAITIPLGLPKVLTCMYKSHCFCCYSTFTSWPYKGIAFFQKKKNLSQSAIFHILLLSRTFLRASAKSSMTLQSRTILHALSSSCKESSLRSFLGTVTPSIFLYFWFYLSLFKLYCKSSITYERNNNQLWKTKHRVLIKTS